MRLRTAFLCEGLHGTQHGVTLSDPWPDWWWLAEIPSTVPLPILVVVQETELSEADQVMVVECRVEDGQGVIGVSPLTLPPQQHEFVAGAPRYRRFGTALLLPFRMVGAHRLIVSTSEGVDLDTVDFGVRLRPPD